MVALDELYLWTFRRDRKEKLPTILLTVGREAIIVQRCTDEFGLLWKQLIEHTINREDELSYPQLLWVYHFWKERSKGPQRKVEFLG